MKPGLLKSPRVIEWLRGKEPAWTLLTFESWCALQRNPNETGCAPSLSEDMSSTLASNATFLFRIGPGRNPRTPAISRARSSPRWWRPSSCRTPIRWKLSPGASSQMNRISRRFTLCASSATSRNWFASKDASRGSRRKPKRWSRKQRQQAQPFVVRRRVLEHEPRLFRRLSLGSLAAAPVRRRERLAKARRSRSPVRGPVIGVLEAERDQLGAISRRAYSEFLHGSICSKRS